MEHSLLGSGNMRNMMTKRVDRTADELDASVRDRSHSTRPRTRVRGSLAPALEVAVAAYVYDEALAEAVLAGSMAQMLNVSSISGGRS